MVRLMIDLEGELEAIHRVVGVVSTDLENHLVIELGQFIEYKTSVLQGRTSISSCQDSILVRLKQETESLIKIHKDLEKEEVIKVCVAALLVNKAREFGSSLMYENAFKLVSSTFNLIE